MLKPLVEVFNSAESAVTLTEADGPGGKKQLVLETVVQRADVKNRNGRVYPRAILEREIAEFRKHISAGTSYGAADHPKPGEVPSVLSQAILWRSIDMDEAGVVKARGVVMDTFAGTQVKGILAAGGAIGTSSRGRGSVTLKAFGPKNEQAEVVTDYKLRTFDLVVDQSVEDAQSRAVKYEQALIEQEEPKTMIITLESLKADHPEVYKNLMAEALKGSEAGLSERLQGMIEAKIPEIRSQVEAELESTGRVLSEEQVGQVQALNAFALVVVEAAKEAGIIDESAATDEEAKKLIESLKAENKSLKAKITALETANAGLSEKLGKTEVQEAAKKLAEGHALSDDLTEALVEACPTMDDFTKKSTGIKTRFDNLAAKITPADVSKGRTFLGEQNNPPKAEASKEGTGSKSAPVLTESQKRLRGLVGING